MTPAGRLEAAVADLAQFRSEWESLGSPWSSVGSTGQEVAHPLIKVIRDAERAVEMLSRPAAAKRGGRPVGAQSSPDRGPVQLSAVK